MFRLVLAYTISMIKYKERAMKVFDKTWKEIETFPIGVTSGVNLVGHKTSGPMQGSDMFLKDGVYYLAKFSHWLTTYYVEQ